MHQEPYLGAYGVIPPAINLTPLRGVLPLPQTSSRLKILVTPLPPWATLSRKLCLLRSFGPSYSGDRSRRRWYQSLSAPPPRPPQRLLPRLVVGTGLLERPLDVRPSFFKGPQV